MELVDGLDVAEDGCEGVRVQSQGFIVPVDTAVEDLGEQIYRGLYTFEVGRVGNGKLKHRPQIGEMDEMKGRVESESESDGARTSWSDQIT